MSLRNIDYLNSFLILLSLALAVVLPFELFLFSYAFLGPMHYLTEINWLDQRNYYLKRKIWKWVLLGLCILITLPLLTAEFFRVFWTNYNLRENLIYAFIANNHVHFITASLFIGAAFVVFRKYWKIITVVIAALIFSILLAGYPIYLSLIALLLPSLIHVYIFTGLFMLYGALKAKSKPGLINVILLLFSPVIIYLLPLSSVTYPVSQGALETYSNMNFQVINISLAKLLGLEENVVPMSLTATAIKTQVFIAFAYTYHYLNWFSKTSIIQWHKVPLKRLLLILAFWGIAISAYLYHYRLGFLLLYFLSFLHVILEFPLNFVSIRGIVSELKQRIISS